jgi:hypothetical protein
MAPHPTPARRRWPLPELALDPGRNAAASRSKSAAISTALVNGTRAAGRPAGEENYWAAACLARAAGRLRGDDAALEQSLAGWERIDARFERACTLLLMNGRADEGRAGLAALGCHPPPA